MGNEWQDLINRISKIANEESGIQLSEKNYSMIESRLRKRFSILGISTPLEYLNYLNKNLITEKIAIVSLLTTHHTYFFREYFHFDDIEKKYIKNILASKKDKVIRVWSAACSNGQEAYSLSMFFHKLKLEKKISDFSYKIIGTDIDVESVRYAKNGVYFYKDISQIPLSYIHGNWLRGKGSIRNFVKPKFHIKEPVSFDEINLMKMNNKFSNDKFDIIFCRNVLIYFNQDQINDIIKNLLNCLQPYGLLVLGISESILGYDLPVKLLSNSIYIHKELQIKPEYLIDQSDLNKKSLIRVLCVDDSPTILVLLKKILSPEKGYKVVDTAINAKEAREKLKSRFNEIDIMTLDIHMPEETGIDYLKSDFKKDKHPPVLIVSSIERDGTSVASTALELGASDYVEKPDLKNFDKTSEEICFKLETIFNNNNKQSLQNNILHSNDQNLLSNFKSNPIKVLIVDDSSTIRMQLKNILSKNKEIIVVGEVEDPRKIESKIQSLKPDVITLDINMPYLNGIDILKLIIPEYKIPTIVVSALNMEEGSLVMEALELGAIDFFQKPSFEQLEEEGKILIDKVIQAKNAKITIRKNQLNLLNRNQSIDNDYLIAIGSSTGGTEALKCILEQLPTKIPPVLIVQHIPPVFSLALAERLNKLCPFEVIEAKDGDLIESNKVYIAPGNKHMGVVKSHNQFYIQIFETNLVNGHRPSVDVLFNSISQLKLSKMVGVILTGMGSDGAKGLKLLKDCGAKTIAQNEETCVVFGMPREAIKLNAVDFIEPIENIPNKIVNIIKLIN